MNRCNCAYQNRPLPVPRTRGDEPRSIAQFKNGEQLRTYDYVIANPPFSDKTWATGLTPSTDPFQRFAWARAELNALPLSAEVWRVTGGDPRGGLDLHLSRTSPRGRR